MITAVPDASVVVKWLLEEPGSEVAMALAELWADRGARVVVPVLLWCEVGNVLHRRTLEGKLTATQARRAVDGLRQLQLETRSEQALMPRALELAWQLRLPSVYDAVYLAIAENEEAELWTFDARLARAASGRLKWVRLAGTAGGGGG